jgi:hypothetical protein
MRTKKYMAILLVVIAIFITDNVTNHRIEKIVNSLFMVKINSSLEKTILGGIAFKDEYVTLFDTRFVNDDNNCIYKSIPLKYIVDISTWEAIPSNNAYSKHFQDINNYYTVYYFEEVYMICTPKKY